jgi:hypothetical protein
MITVPIEFNHLTQWFYQGSLEEMSSPETWVASALAHLDKKQQRIVKRFLDELLSADYSDTELQEFWSSTATDYYLDDGQGLRGFLTMIRDMIE